MIIRLYILALEIDRKRAQAAGLAFYCAPKPCKRCGEYLRNTYGACLECKRRDNVQWRNRDEYAAREYMRLAARKHRSIEENRMRGVMRAQVYKKKNPYKAKVRRIESWYARNTFAAKQHYRTYYAEHREEYYNRARIRRARLKGAEGYFDGIDIFNIYRSQNGMCVYCENREDLHLDHKIPLSRGGSNWPYNLQWLCQFHNLSKATKTDSEYRALLAEGGFIVRTPF